MSPLYEVESHEMRPTAKALLSAADDPSEITTSHSGFYVTEDLWHKAFPPAEPGQHAAADDEPEVEAAPVTVGEAGMETVVPQEPDTVPAEPVSEPTPNADAAADPDADADPVDEAPAAPKPAPAQRKTPARKTP